MHRPYGLSRGLWTPSPCRGSGREASEAIRTCPPPLLKQRRRWRNDEGAAAKQRRDREHSVLSWPICVGHLRHNVQASAAVRRAGTTELRQISSTDFVPGRRRGSSGRRHEPSGMPRPPLWHLESSTFALDGALLLRHPRGGRPTFGGGRGEPGWRRAGLGGTVRLRLQALAAWSTYGGSPTCAGFRVCRWKGLHHGREQS
mmetsp:Transcript_60159/g.127432  ORF Transcript_60159/g.127432 Transcript_60159/m.127432 type:complete len:201 (-) Transcript_60159:1105-1707(-)